LCIGQKQATDFTDLHRLGKNSGTADYADLRRLKSEIWRVISLSFEKKELQMNANERK